MNIITSRIKNIVVLIFIISLFVIFILNATELTQNIIRTLFFCFNKLIPSIFPFMILSSVFAQYCFEKKHNNKTKLFGIEKRLFSIIIPSWISGYIIGPKLLGKNLVNDDITDYAIITSNAGIGFVVSFVGLALWKNLNFGIFLYIVQITSAIVIFNLTKKSRANDYYTTITQKPLLTILTEAINNSTKTMLDICGFTIFFSVIKTSLCFFFNIKQQDFLYILISCVLEVSDGSLTASISKIALLAGFFTGFSIGFGGLSIFAQTISVAQGKINAKKFLGIKFLQGIICGIFSMLYVKFFNVSPNNSIHTSLVLSSNSFSIITSSFFIFFLLIYFKKIILNQI